MKLRLDFMVLLQKLIQMFNKEYPSGGIRNVAANSEQGQMAQSNVRAAQNFRRRKYSLELLNLAAARALEIGPKAASEETGVGQEVLKKHMYVTKMQKQNAGQIVLMRKAKNQLYSVELKRSVVQKAYQIQRDTGLPIKKCFVNAGRLHNANGLSIHSQMTRGLFTL